MRPNYVPLLLFLVLPALFPTDFWFGSPFIFPLYFLSGAIGYLMTRPRGDSAEDAQETHYLLSRPMKRRDWFGVKLGFSTTCILALWLILIPYSYPVRGGIHAWFVAKLGDSVNPPDLLDGFYLTGTPGWCWAWLLTLLCAVVGSVLGMFKQVLPYPGQRLLLSRPTFYATWVPLLLASVTILGLWLHVYGNKLNNEAANTFGNPDRPWILLSACLILLLYYSVLCFRRLPRWDQGI
jgi:hypothetical protein